jgi:hypothetical protein
MNEESGNHLPESAGAREASWEAVEHISEQLMHQVGHGMHLVGSWAATEIGAVGVTAAHASAGIVSAFKGDWQGAGDHAADMSNSAANFLSGGLLGAVESTTDAAAAVNRLQGVDAPTSSEVLHEGFRDVGNAVADGIFFFMNPDAVPGPGAGSAGHVGDFHPGDGATDSTSPEDAGTAPVGEVDGGAAAHTGAAEDVTGANDGGGG